MKAKPGTKASAPAAGKGLSERAGTSAGFAAVSAAPVSVAPISAAPASRLGRGLGTLLRVNLPAPPQAGSDQAGQPGGRPAAAEASAVAPTVGPTIIVQSGPAHIPLTAIRPNPHQPRREISQASLEELASSIKANGVIQPILLRKDAAPAPGITPDASGATYTLIAGERRWRASQKAGMATIPSIIREADEFTGAQWALVENIHREDLNPIDRGFAYQALMGQLGLTQADLAIRLGEDRSSVASFCRLLTLSEAAKNYIRAGELSIGHGKVLAGVPDVLEQTRLAELAVSQQLTVRNLERVVQKLLEGKAALPPEAEPKVVSAHLVELERRISGQLGMRVQLRAGRSKGKGRIVMHYASLEQFDSLMEKLGVEVDAG